MSNVLIVRHFRIGDAVIPIPLIYSLAQKYPQDNFVVLSNSRFAPIFECMPANVSFIPMIGKGRGFLRGPKFIFKRFFFLRKLQKLNFDKIAMLQFETSERKLWESYSKRKCEIAICSETEFRDNKRLKKEDKGGISMIGLYKEVFAKLGYHDLDLDFNAAPFKTANITPLLNKLGIDGDKKLVAIAPFSKQEQKIYHLDKMKRVAGYFSENHNIQVLIFGGGNKEKNIVENWRREYPQILSTIDKLTLKEELELIAQSSVAITMDSANLHFASLLDTPVVSIWGASHPDNGYYVTRKGAKYETVIKDIDCQPCSIFGFLPCSQKELMKCMNIEPEIIINKVEKMLND